MRFRFLLPCALLVATTALAQNHAPSVVPIPNLTVRPGTPPLTIVLSNVFSDQDLQSIVGTQVRFDTTLGPLNIELFDTQTPATVANFLQYISSGRYANVFWQRVAPGQDIDTGGNNFVDGIGGNAVVAFPAVRNEPGISNTRGTVAMIKNSTDPDSATSLWYVNLADTGGPPLNRDILFGGYTVFGRVIEGNMTTVDAIAAVPTYIIPPIGLNALPLRNYTPGQNATSANFIYLGNAATGPKITFNAQSDNTGIVNPALNGLVLTLTPSMTGTATLTVSATDFNGAIGRSISTVTVTPTAPFGNMRNISTRAKVGVDENVLIGGFVITGTGTKRLLIRALGSELAARGVPTVLGDPFLQLYQGSIVIAQNNTWNVQTIPADVAAIQATPFAPTDIQEPALLARLGAGAYTVIVTGVAGTTGNSLIEVYELDTTDTAKLINISTRGSVGTVNDVMIGGFVVGGTTPKRVLVRAVGPSLAGFGVVNPLLNPALQIFSGATPIAQNDDWGTAPGGGPNPDAAAITASGFQPTSAQESAVIMTLIPGAYTAIVRGVNSTTGVGLIEVYDLD